MARRSPESQARSVGVDAARALQRGLCSADGEARERRRWRSDDLIDGGGGIGRCRRCFDRRWHREARERRRGGVLMRAIWDLMRRWARVRRDKGAWWLGS
ncbi:hypothetical protein M0R45_036288 [Rubus argutus]|uniref:Uncharacterized protein n=1 Tax=Rubus argutus TaxID=59490 RepID=A0AAW1VWJ1_RUBAR